MTLEDLRLRNTQQLIEDVAARISLDEDSVTLVLVDRPSARQRAIPPRHPDRRTIVVTVIVRRGFNVWTRIEKVWAMAWRYSNHLTDAFDADIIVVTEHGWASLESHAAGPLPCLVEAA